MRILRAIKLLKQPLQAVERVLEMRLRSQVQIHAIRRNL